MKRIASLMFVSLLSVGALHPSVASALSCLDPMSSIEYYLEDDSNSIFTAVAGDTVEHVLQPASTDGDPNRMHNQGYVGQLVSVSEVHKGTVESEKWVYYETNGTWGYLCTNQPPAADTTNLYVVNNGDGFSLPTVVQVFAVDSDPAQTITDELTKSETTGYLQETTASSWQQDLGQTLREMVVLLRIRLIEWRWWMGQ